MRIISIYTCRVKEQALQVMDVYVHALKEDSQIHSIIPPIYSKHIEIFMSSETLTYVYYIYVSLPVDFAVLGRNHQFHVKINFVLFTERNSMQVCIRKQSQIRFVGATQKNGDFMFLAPKQSRFFNGDVKYTSCSIIYLKINKKLILK